MSEERRVATVVRPVGSWVRRNVIDAAPQWAELLRSALANVRTVPHERT